MKKLMAIAVLLFIVISAHAQVKYTVNKVAYGKVGTDGKVTGGEFKQLFKRFVAYYYGDALVFDEGYDGVGGIYYKFVRTINTGNPNKHKFNALDKNGKACEITIKDYNNYSLIDIKYMDSTSIICWNQIKKP